MIEKLSIPFYPCAFLRLEERDCLRSTPHVRKLVARLVQDGLRTLDWGTARAEGTPSRMLDEPRVETSSSFISGKIDPSLKHVDLILEGMLRG